MMEPTVNLINEIHFYVREVSIKSLYFQNIK